MRNALMKCITKTPSIYLKILMILKSILGIAGRNILCKDCYMLNQSLAHLSLSFCLYEREWVFSTFR